jgi:hypothetical protein
MIVELTNKIGTRLPTAGCIFKEDLTIIPKLPSGGGGGGSMEGFHMVRFFNDDRTTLLYTVYVADGSSAIYAGDTPVSTEDASGVFLGFEPAAVNVTEDMDCYAVYESAVGTLDETPWAKISALSAGGAAQNFFAVGDTKMIHIRGTVGTLDVNGDYGVYIIGFNHNSEVEGNGIHFGTFKSEASNGIDLCLVDSKYKSSDTKGKKLFNMNHWGNYNYGGWAGCDMRYDILGSTDKAPSGYGAEKTHSVVGYDASATCATTPVAGTLMAALPADLRAVMKPMTKYTDGKGNFSDAAANVVATIDYLPLLAEFEIFGARKSANSYEQDKQKQYDYFVAGNSKLKYCHSDTGSTAIWRERSASYINNDSFCFVSAVPSSGVHSAYYSHGVAPIFKV